MCLEIVAKNLSFSEFFSLLTIQELIFVFDREKGLKGCFDSTARNARTLDNGTIKICTLCEIYPPLQLLAWNGNAVSLEDNGQHCEVGTTHIANLHELCTTKSHKLSDRFANVGKSRIYLVGTAIIGNGIDA